MENEIIFRKYNYEDYKLYGKMFVIRVRKLDIELYGFYNGNFNERYLYIQQKLESCVLDYGIRDIFICVVYLVFFLYYRDVFYVIKK